VYVYNILVGKPEGKGYMCRWEDNIKIILKNGMHGCGLDFISS
jgi:hypothetical protein